MADKAAQERGWPYLLRLGSESNRDLRKISLVRAYAWVEHALGASGFTNGTVASRLLDAHRNGVLGASLGQAEIREAISLRHRAAHEETIPGVSDCERAIRILATAWEKLRQGFVVFPKACDVADKLSKIEGVAHVYLYGSLARRAASPRDIDL